MPALAKPTTMNVPIRKPCTRQKLFSSAETRNIRHGSDGFQPVAMTGGNAGPSAVATNVLTALRNRLRGSGYRSLGPDAGVETVNRTVRHPDPGDSREVQCQRPNRSRRRRAGILSPRTGCIDRIVEVREYALSGAWSFPSPRRCCAGSHGLFDKVTHFIGKVHLCF